MAEAWRLEEDEEELGRRHRRGNLGSAPDRSERHKPDYRSSGQGPLSSIKAAIKRTSRTGSEHQRERRRPEITIVAAEPLRPSSWFPGGSHITPQGLGFPPTTCQAQWRTSELVPAELPPSYEQVIKEINQVQVHTTNNNNAAASRPTTTSATQTDFPEEIISHLSNSNVKNNLFTICESESAPAVQSPLKPPRPSSSFLNSSPSENETPLIVLEASEEQNCQKNPTIVIRPVPKPRSKGNLKPIVKATQGEAQDNRKGESKPTAEREVSPNQQLSLLDDSLNNHVVVDSMNAERNQNSIVSRIKVFESQTNTDTSGLSKKPEIAPRCFPQRPTVTAKKPVVAPKPGANRVSGEWDSWTERKPKPVSRELHPQPQESGSSVVTKPELPKKPKPSLVTSTSNDLLHVRTGSASENDGQKKFPVPAPRPLVPKKSLYLENPDSSSALLKPVSAVPRLSVHTQAKAFQSVGELSATSVPAPTLQSKPDEEGDLISFDDDVLPPSSVSAGKECISSEAAADPFQLPCKNEPAKEQTVQPAVARKPTVIRIPAKPGKSLNEVLHIPPPLPAEKPIGNTSEIAAGKPNNVEQTKKVEFEHSDCGGTSRTAPVLPPRPVDGKIIPARPPPPKGIPGRPLPPKLSGTKTPSSQNDPFCRSSSDMIHPKKPGKFGLGIKRSKSQVLKSQDPVLPPRPKPGHPLYNKYMKLAVPRAIAKEDFIPRNPGELSSKGSNSSLTVCDTNTPHAIVLHDFPAEHADDLDLHSGDSIFLLERIDKEWYRGKCGNRTGIFPASFVKVIVDVPEEANKRKISFSSVCIKGPRCIARFEYIGDQKDELSFVEGEIIILKEYVNEEWAKGELKGASGIFPLNFVEIIEDLPGLGTSISAVCVGGPVKRENSASLSQNNRRSGEWCEALHDFTAETDEDLPFKKGDCIRITERLDSQWYRGRLNEREGIFPAVFVQNCSGGVKSSQSVGWKKGKAKALYDFHGENEDELSFKAGDVITELEPVDEDWMSGEIKGKRGIFPKNFVQVL
ncbi:SH3 domain-containing protein 19 isoform X3 [Alligator mississippiensis]|uniref:SH3 domain-containing protein 19 isoform X3 n=1 Tax=Alligator mississippiensis TaxID=8496 RepID=UPI0028774B42|nr:SH3 domain-containing protein 19 isoform X3 [Alligator mississippiensis]